MPFEFDSIESSVERELNPRDFIAGFCDSAFQEPLRAIGQLSGERVPETGPKTQSLAAQAGQLAGFIFDFSILSKATSVGLKSLLGKTAEGVAGHAITMSTAGGLHGAFLTPSSNSNKSLLSGRVENSLRSAATFGVMGGTGKALEAVIPVRTALPAKIVSNFIAGIAGGVVDAFGSALSNERRTPRLEEILGSAGEFALFGAGFGAIDHGMTKLAESWPGVSKEARSQYFRAKWALRDMRIETRRTAYSVLNEYDMRHPLQRLGNLVYGFDPVGDAPRPALTAENNPVTAFETALPDHLNELAEHWRIVEQLPRLSSERADFYDQGKHISDDFAFRLLQLWHGTAEQPGLKNYSAAELATSAAPVARVAQIREALLTSVEHGVPDCRLLFRKIAELSPNKPDLGKDNGELEFLHALSNAKERFFQYDESELSRRMAMPSIFAAMDHHGATPLSWMPFEATERLPNLFHGTISHSLPSIFMERAMFPGFELKLRGVAQITGESALSDHPRRAISLTRDFNEAWAYHRHSPLSVTSYPVVFGVSADVVPRAYSAGCVEPGELLINKLRLGDSIWTRLGLRTPDITHIYVPDTEVGSVNQQLRAYRIRGVNAVGLSDLPKPPWKPEPTRAELIRHYGYGS